MSSGLLSFAKSRNAFIGRLPLGSPVVDEAAGALGSLFFLDLAFVLGTGPSTNFLLLAALIKGLGWTELGGCTSSDRELIS